MSTLEKRIQHLEMMGYIVDNYPCEKIMVQLKVRDGLTTYFTLLDKDELFEPWCIEKIVRKINDQIIEVL